GAMLTLRLDAGAIGGDDACAARLVRAARELAVAVHQTAITCGALPAVAAAVDARLVAVLDAVAAGRHGGVAADNAAGAAGRSSGASGAAGAAGRDAGRSVAPSTARVGGLTGRAGGRSAGVWTLRGGVEVFLGRTRQGPHARHYRDEGGGQNEGRKRAAHVASATCADGERRTRRGVRSACCARCREPSRRASGCRRTRRARAGCV